MILPVAKAAWVLHLGPCELFCQEFATLGDWKTRAEWHIPDSGNPFALDPILVDGRLELTNDLTEAFMDELEPPNNISWKFEWVVDECLSLGLSFIRISGPTPEKATRLDWYDARDPGAGIQHLDCEHLNVALSIPWDQLRQRVPQLPEIPHFQVIRTPEKVQQAARCEGRDRKYLEMMSEHVATLGSRANCING